MRTRLSAALAVLLVTMAPAMAEETVLLHAAGSLRAALTEANAFEAAGLGKVQAKFGASGLLKADPSGDYAWEVFRKAEKLKAGASAALEKKALQLTGGPTSPPAPQGRSVYGELIAQGAADIFLTYCTNALAAQRENSMQQIVQLPDALAVGADYGLTVMNGASAPAYKFALFILSAEGQRTLAKHGFAAPALSQ
jgi:molybdate transport system substrate-binding protein